MAQFIDPFVNFNFLIEIGGTSWGAFQQCSGFDSSIDVVEFPEGGQNMTTHKLPGRTKYSNIQLKQGMMTGSKLYDWHRKTIDGEIERMSGSIVLLNRKGEEVARWNFEGAWPAKYDGPDLSLEDQKVAIETFELAHEKLYRA